MRRSARKGELKGDSCVLPESGGAELPDGLMTQQDDLVRSSWMPRFKFVQSSHYSAETSVNGETETVHWIVKDRPFAIRIQEVPTLPSNASENSTTLEQASVEMLSWKDVEVRVAVVYKANKEMEVRPTGGQAAPLHFESNVIPPHAYNHRRNQSILSGEATPPEGALLKLTDGAGIELNSRLSVLSSHLRTDFCLHIQLFLRQLCVASWHSLPIRTVSKWDKVRLLQESSFLSYPRSTASSRGPPAASPPLFVNHSHPSSSSLGAPSLHTVVSKRVVKPPRKNTNAGLLTSVSSRTTRHHGATTPSALLPQATQMPVSSSMPKVPAPADPDHADADSLPPASPSSTPFAPAVATSPAPRFAERTPSSAAASSYSASSTRGKKKGSGEEVFTALAELRRTASDLTHLAKLSAATPSTKKRKASWEASCDDSQSTCWPSEEEAASGAQSQLAARRFSSVSSSSSSLARNNKRAKMVEVGFGPSQTHRFASASVATSCDSQMPANTTAAAKFAEYARQFLHMLDQMPVGEAREALANLLYSRPHLASTLSCLMNYNPDATLNSNGTDSNAFIGHGTSQVASSDFVVVGTSSFHPSAAQAVANSCNPPQMSQQRSWQPIIPQEDSYDLLLSETGPVAPLSASYELQHPSNPSWQSQERYDLLNVVDECDLRCDSGPAALQNGSSALFHGYRVDDPSMLSPSAFDEESVTMGSPNSYSSGQWVESPGADWYQSNENQVLSSSVSLPFSPFFSQLTASALVQGSTEMHVGM